MKRTLIALCALALLAGGALAQTAGFQAAVDRNQVGSGEQFTLQFTLTNAGTGGGKNLQLPDLSKFHIMSGPNESSSMQIVNGAVSSSVTYSYILQPKEIGKFTIGAASIEAGGNTLKSAPLTVEVVKGSTRAKQQSGGQDDAAAQIGDNLFLKATVDRTHVVQGEQVNLVFKIYTRVSIASYAVQKNPTMTGFWGEDVETPKNIQTNP
ncbi:MAG TPA: BatD family protein, partial [Bacteroidota bacterium]|nr:BatD family protein [Bacteroidota bacterium]